MGYEHCTEEDLQLIGQALRAVAEHPVFPDQEFRTLFGLDRAEVAAVARRWPHVDAGDPDVDLAVNNTLANLWGYPLTDDEYAAFVPVPRERLRQALERWQLPPQG